MNHKKTKIVCTIGPASWSAEMLKKLAVAGMNVARLNFSHGTHAEKGHQIELIRKISREIGKPLAVLADMSGPKLRLGSIEGTREIKKGNTVQLSLAPVADELPLQFDLSPFVKKGQRIFLNDGLLALKVESVQGKTIKTVALNDGWVSSNKGVNVPDTQMKDAAFTEKDQTDAEFALSKEVDYLAVSFVQTVDDLRIPLQMIKKSGKHTKLIVKVEKAEAIKNIEDIIAAADGIMVARGDLGIEIPASEVPIAQQKIVRLCRQMQKPVTVCTQMLESMTENPRPTRAEVSDVANAVLDQVDAVMLSAETASGKYPIEAVTTMKEIILSVEEHPDYSNFINIDWESIPDENYASSAIAAAAAALAARIKAKVIVVPTASGKITRLLSSFRPTAQIVAVTHDEPTQNQLALIWNLRSVLAKPAGNFDHFLEKAIHTVQHKGFAHTGDKIVVVTGSTVGLSGSTDTIKVVKL